MAMKSSAKKIEWIDGVKGFAIIAILLNHFVESFGPGPWFSNPSYNWPEFSVRMTTLFPTDGRPLIVRIIEFMGWLGDMAPGVFILLSGLTLTISALNKPLHTLDFYKKRLLRIYPLYIAIHLIVLVAAIYWFKWDIHPFSIATLLSLLGLRFTNSLFFYINPSWWFIWVIIQMYFLFPFLLILLKKKGVRNFLIITFCVTILSRLLGILGYTYSSDLYYWMTGIFGGTRLFEFTFGMYIGYLIFSDNLSLSKLLLNKRKFLFLSFCIYALGFIFSWTYVGSLLSNIFITVGLSGLFYSIFQIFFERNNSIKTSLLWIGKNSFSVFLLHQPFFIYVTSLCKGIHRGIALTIAIALSFLIGYLIDKLIALIMESIKIHKARITAFFNSKLNRRLILGIILIAMISSFFIMLGFWGIGKIFKLSLLLLLLDITITRISEKFKTSFFSRFFDMVLILSLIILVITYNWYSTYWLLLLLSLIFLEITIKLPHSVAIIVSMFFLLITVFGVESYLKKNKPIEVLKWGEYPILQMDSVSIFSLIPNKTTHLKYNNYDYYVKTNSLGFASPEIDLSKKAENEKRVLILGDAFSMPEGMEYNSSYPYLLEQQLRKDYPNFIINVINAGVTGYGPNEEYAQLNKYIKIIKPDIIINQFFVNEYEDITVSKLERRSNIGFFVDKSIKEKYFGNAQTPSHLNNFAQNLFGIVNKSFLSNKSLLYFYEKNSPFLSDTVINKVSNYFDAMKNLCSTNNAKYIVMYVPGQIEVSMPKFIAYYPYFENLKDTNVFNFPRPQMTTKGLCDEKGISYINTTEFLKNYPVQPVYFTESWHWNKAGHLAISKYLEEYINNNNLIVTK